MPKLLVSDLGTRQYAGALELQRAVARARISGAFSEDLLLLVEHPPVVTLGRSSKEQHLLASPELLRSRGVELHEVERGGDVTFHGPGQLVGYPIIDLKRHKQDLHWFLRQVEETLIVALAPFGIVGERSKGFTGVWTGGRKIASIGVHARDWVTWHGFALNVTTDLSWFDLMVPCGIAAVEMTSVEREIVQVSGTAGASRLGQAIRQTIVAAFCSVFSLEAETLTSAELECITVKLATA
ncbi:MAG: Octanoyltransferase [Gemmatimonadetes bacterium]|nr:Octanoyltransferase [Gemmatimonadota bacterium]